MNSELSNKNKDNGNTPYISDKKSYKSGASEIRRGS